MFKKYWKKFKLFFNLELYGKNCLNSINNLAIFPNNTKLRGKIKDAKMANIVPISLKILSNQSEYKNLKLKKNQDKYM